jgi:hypothetical protein
MHTCGCTKQLSIQASTVLLCANVAVVLLLLQQSDASMAKASEREAPDCATLVLLVLLPHLTDAKLSSTVQH